MRLPGGLWTRFSSDGSSPQRSGSEFGLRTSRGRRQGTPGPPSHLSYLGSVSNTSVMPRLTSKGQVTVPVAVRYALGLAPGDEVVFAMQGDRGVFRRATALDALR